MYTCSAAIVINTLSIAGSGGDRLANVWWTARALAMLVLVPPKPSTKPRRLLPRIRPRGPRVRAPRRRRSPELARQEILDAADRVFIEFQPDQVGLKDVAREAGVSHALIVHYFGSYPGLIEAALERRMRTMRDRILGRVHEAVSHGRPGELLEVLFRTLDDPVHLRLMRWLFASERPSAAHAFALRDQGLQLVARQIAFALDPRADATFVGKVEIALLCGVSAAYGYAIGKYALVGALGRQASIELDREVQATLATMLQNHLGGVQRR
jgi:TetR/AcrR family transcriptional regulator, repressor for neighboring sulfatase